MLRMLLLAILLTACDSGSSTQDPPMQDPPLQEPPSRDPFATLEDTSEGLTNAGTDLDAILENGALTGACAAWEADRTDRKKMLLCGKWMFFYESFNTGGVPAPIIDF